VDDVFPFSGHSLCRWPHPLHKQRGLLDWFSHYKIPRHGPRIKRSFQQYSRCHGNLFVSRSLPSNGPVPKFESRKSSLHCISAPNASCIVPDLLSTLFGRIRIFTIRIATEYITHIVPMSFHFSLSLKAYAFYLWKESKSGLPFNSCSHSTRSVRNYSTFQQPSILHH
jgi:hypothetical protein